MSMIHPVYNLRGGQSRNGADTKTTRSDEGREDAADVHVNPIRGVFREISRQAGMAMAFQRGAVSFEGDTLRQGEAAPSAANPQRAKAKALWKKLADNRKSYDGNAPASPAGRGAAAGSGGATRHSAFWRLTNGAAAFLHSVDRDVDGKRKSKAAGPHDAS